MEILTSLVGVNFRPAEAKEIVDALEIGDMCELVRDPANPYDSNAVQVHFNDTFIGFIPKVDNAEIANHLDGGAKASCEVVSFLGTRKPGLKVTLLNEAADESVLSDTPDVDDENFGDD